MCDKLNMYQIQKKNVIKIHKNYVRIFCTEHTGREFRSLLSGHYRLVWVIHLFVMNDFMEWTEHALHRLDCSHLNINNGLVTS